MAIQRTVPGTYQAPVEGIVDYGAFGRGLEKGIAPGLKFLEEQDLEAKKKEKQRKARAAGIKEFGVAGGELYGNTFNADKVIQEDYRAEAQRIRGLLLDPNTTDQDKKLLERQWENLSATNASVQLLIDIDNDSELYSQEASNLNDLFVSQGSSIDEFRNAYNKGDARPVVKIIDGISVGGFEITAEDGSKKFLDFQYKINQNTINGSVELRSDKRLQTAATGFGKAQGTTVKETDQWVNAGDDTIGTTKRTRLLKQSIDSKISEAETSAAEYVAQNPELMPGLYADLAIDKKFLTEEEKQFINLHGTKYNRFKPEGLSAVMAEIAKENPELTPKQLEQRANTEINNTRDNLLQKYIKNEFLKNTSDFYTQKEDLKDENGNIIRKAGLVYPQDDIFESSTKPITQATGATRSAAGIVEDLNTQFNSITSDAEREFNTLGFIDPETNEKILFSKNPDRWRQLNKLKDSGEDVASFAAYKSGTTRSGETQAPQMFNFLTNKSYMKGGSEKSIDNVEYRIVGEGEDRKIFLDIFTRSAGKEDLLKTVDLSDTIARRDFLTNIGQGLAVTSSEKQAVREETKALTESREIAFDVFKGLNVGGKDSSRWDVLSRAIRNNSSEGLNLEERRAFLKAGYGKQ
jgi:hypothetical protein